MTKIEVLGPGCNNCQRLEANAREALTIADVDGEIVKVTDYAQIAAYGIMSTPGLVIDGKVVSYGRIPSSRDIAEWLSLKPSSAMRTAS
jgi:small redox-active disulfide protein 2